MNLPHLHILLNHVPTVGFSLGVALFVSALFAKSQDLKRASLAVLFFIAVLTTAVFVSGSAAVDAICPPGQPCMSGVTQTAIKSHEDMALLAYALMQLTGAFAFLGLWRMRRTLRVGAGTSGAIVILSLLTFGLMARAATIGGEIRHPEIIEASDSAADDKTAESPKSTFGESAFTETAAEGEPAEGAESAETAKTKEKEPGWLTTTAIRSFILDTEWAWPASEALHFLGLCLLFSVVLIVDLRILGMAKALPISAVHKILPWGLVGFGMNVFTGMLFFIAAPEQYTGNWVFFWKIVLIVLAGANAMYFLVFEEPWTAGPNGNAPLRSKMAALSAIALWIGVLFFGHMLPFLGNAF